jgi:hypothetical protein
VLYKKGIIWLIDGDVFSAVEPLDIPASSKPTGSDNKEDNMQFLLRMYYALKNMLIDLKFGKPLYKRKKASLRGHNDTVSTDYSLMPFFFASRVDKDDVFVDVGCGQGRVINWLLLTGHTNKIYGIEYEYDIAEGVKKRLSRYPNVVIIAGDALQSAIADASFVYLANPFDEALLKQFNDKIKDIARRSHRMTVVYYRILHINVFLKDPEWSVEIHTIPRNKLDGRSYLDDDSYRTYAIIRWRGKT